MKTPKTATLPDPSSVDFKNEIQTLQYLKQLNDNVREVLRLVRDDLRKVESGSLSSALTVPNGGTGAVSLTDGGLLIGGGTDAITSLAQASNGQLPIGSTGADPVLAALTAGAGVSITNGAGSITIAADVGLSDLTETHKTANSMTVTTGTLSSGTVTDTQTWADGNSVNISEVTGVPGYDVRFTFTSVTDFKRIGISAYYDGSSSHACEMQIYDYTNATWRILWTFSTGMGFNYRYSDLPVSEATRAADYINGSNEVLIRFYHPQTGNASHDLYIDYVSLIG